MLDSTDLKTWLHRDLSQRDKLLLILATFDAPCQVKEMKDRAKDAGLRIPAAWNPSAALGKSKGLAIRTPQGWEITDAGRQHLRNLGVTKISPAAVQVATDLRAELSNIKSADTRAFVEEAIRCHEAELYRSAIVMSWLSAVDVLHNHVQGKHLKAFNAEAKRVDAKWKDAKTTDDLGKMGEADFLDRIAALSIIGKNVKEELKTCLKRRNGCGHPNSLKIGANTSAHHLEILLLNVFKVFQ
ncbi:MAG: hypothetical protein FVQ81_09720 [Candidatus Glassbacteria bacterium]|nr:hypothetical protein [Candidatus Glassbacteria bacterium]